MTITQHVMACTNNLSQVGDTNGTSSVEDEETARAGASISGQPGASDLSEPYGGSQKPKTLGTKRPNKRKK